MELTHVVVPACRTARTAGTTKGDTLLFGEHTDTLGAVLEDDVASEDVVVFLNILTHVRNELLDTLLEIRMNIGHHTADGVIVQNQASAAGFLEDVKNLLTVAETIKECRGGTEVLTEAGEEQDVGVDTLQLIHNSTDDLHAIAHLNAHSLLDTHAERVAVLHGAEIVETVSEGQGLRISQAFADFLHAAVDISEHRVDLANALAVEAHAEMKHTVG